MSIPLGDRAAGSIINFKFTTVDSTGVPTVLTGSPAIQCYKDDGTTQDTDGLTLTASFDSVTGLNHVKIDTSQDATFYSDGSDFDIVLSAGTVDGVSVVGYVVAHFSFGKATADIRKWLGTGVFADTAGVPRVTVKDGTGTGEIATTNGKIDGVILADATTTLNGIADAVAQKIAHVILRRTMANVEAAADGDILNKSSLYGAVQQMQEANTTTHANKLTVFKTDGTTELGQISITSDPGAEPITGLS